MAALQFSGVELPLYRKLRMRLLSVAWVMLKVSLSASAIQASWMRWFSEKYACPFIPDNALPLGSVNRGHGHLLHLQAPGRTILQVLGKRACSALICRTTLKP